MADKGLQPTLIALLYVFPTLSGIVVAVRLWRKRVDRTLGLDDALILLAWLLALANCILTHIYSLKTYAGYHDEDVPFPLIDWTEANKFLYALAIVYNPVICIIKASFLWSLQRLRSRNKWIVRSLWTMQAVNLAYMIGAVVATILPCIPIKKQFDPTIPGHCYSPVTFVIGNVSVAIITDAIVLLIPTWMIYDLQMPLRKKLITIAFLSLGFIVIIIGVLRLIWLVSIFEHKVKNYSVESSYSAIESNIAIIGTSGPTVKYIFGFIFPSLRGSMQKKSSQNYPSGGYATGNSSWHPPSSRRMQSNNAYGDLDSHSIDREVIEMKSDWQWKKDKDLDARSDEERITTDVNDGIVKTVDWNVSSGDAASGRRVPATGEATHSRTAVQPATAL